MPKCGVCGWSFSERTLATHAQTACGEEDSKASSVKYAPEKTINDLMKEIEEGKANEM